MTRPVQEPTTERKLSQFGFRTNQLERRPGAESSNVGFTIKVVSDTTVLTTGDGKFIFAIPEDLDLFDLTHVEAWVTTVSSSGTVTVQLRNITQAQDMLSTRVTIDASEKNSKTAASAVVINTANDDVAWADEIAVDVDVAGTGAKGLGLNLTFSR